MKLSCNVVKDILPLVAEDLASEDTIKLVNDHLKICPQCNQEYIDLKSEGKNYKSINKLETVPLKSIKRKIKNKNVYIGVLSSLIICLFLVIAVNIVTKPLPLSYMEAIETTKVEDGKFFIKFKPEVSNYSIVSSGFNHEIMAWKTKTSKIFNNEDVKNTVINIDDEKSTIVNYISQINDQDELLYGKSDYEGQLTLPRLSMNYYLLVMTFIVIIAIFFYFIFRNTDKIKKSLKVTIIFLSSYILGHISILGINGSTHHITRDLFFVIVSSILFFSIIILLVYKKTFLNIK